MKLNVISKINKLIAFCSGCCSQMDRWTLLCSALLCIYKGCLFTLLWTSTSSTNPLVFILVLPESLIVGSDACVQFLTHVRTFWRVLITASRETKKPLQSHFEYIWCALHHIQASVMLCTVPVPFPSFLCNSSRGWYNIIDLVSLNFPFVIRYKVPLSLFAFTVFCDFCFFSPLIFCLFCFCSHREILVKLSVQCTFTFNIWVTYSKH